MILDNLPTLQKRQPKQYDFVILLLSLHVCKAHPLYFIFLRSTLNLSFGFTSNTFCSGYWVMFCKGNCKPNTRLNQDWVEDIISIPSLSNQRRLMIPIPGSGYGIASFVSAMSCGIDMQFLWISVPYKEYVVVSKVHEFDSSFVPNPIKTNMPQ